MLDAAWLGGRLPGRAIHCLESTPSTMTDLAKLAAEGARHGTIVIADRQTAGQGRHGHGWHSEPGAGLYLSILIRPEFAIESTPALTLAIGLAARDALRDLAGVECDLRWPNDLMLGGRKCGGILVHLLYRAALAGIGVNLNHESFPRDLADSATSLRIETGRDHLREPLAAAIAEAVDARCAVLAKHGPRPVIAEFSRVSSYARGLRVTVDRPEGPLHGETAGLDANGFLLVRDGDGRVVTVLAGGVRPARS